jgi:hypothetical protein
MSKLTSAKSLSGLAAKKEFEFIVPRSPRPKRPPTKATPNLSATSKLVIQTALLCRSVSQIVPFDSDIGPFAFGVVLLGGAPKFLAVQSFRAIFLGNFHAHRSNRGGSMQHSQSPGIPQNCGDTNSTLSVVTCSTSGKRGLFFVNSIRRLPNST